jgi:Flp pilus assembly pilin Flp
MSVGWLRHEEAALVWQELKRLLADESGPELVEWAVVTIILIVVPFLVMQAIGVELTHIYYWVRSALG